MIKISNKAPNIIKVGDIVIPAFSSVLVNSAPSTLEMSKLLNRGILSIYYVPDGAKPTNTIKPTKEEPVTALEDIETKSVETTEFVNNSVETEIKPTRKKRTKTVDTTTDETNLMKGDMNNASDND